MKKSALCTATVVVRPQGLPRYVSAYSRRRASPDTRFKFAVLLGRSLTPCRVENWWAGPASSGYFPSTVFRLRYHHRDSIQSGAQLFAVTRPLPSSGLRARGLAASQAAWLKRKTPTAGCRRGCRCQWPPTPAARSAFADGASQCAPTSMARAPQGGLAINV